MQVYLSRSNQSDPVIYDRVKTVLSKLDCTVVEYNGDPKDTEPITDSDIFLIIPPSTLLREGRPRVGDSMSYHVGKGQWTFLAEFLNYHATFEEVNSGYDYNNAETLRNFEGLEWDGDAVAMVVLEAGEENIYISEVNAGQIMGSDWKTHYAIIGHHNDYININSYIGEKRQEPQVFIIQEEQEVLDATGQLVKRVIQRQVDKARFEEWGKKQDTQKTSAPVKPAITTIHLAAARYLGII